jgi:hypothetical protein
MLALLLPSLLPACALRPAGVFVYAEDAVAPVLVDAVAFIGDERIVLEASSDPAADVARIGRRDLAIGVVADLDCGECFRVDQVEDGAFVVHGGGPLGVQIGLADVLERHGWRFFHPWQSVRPTVISLIDAEGLGVTEEPEQSLRGLDPHTLHPIEGLFDLWVPSEEGLAGAKRIVDWVVKNRGNHLQWPGLDDIVDPVDGEVWRAHTAQIVDYAHARGVRVGVGVQLFGGANLQRAYDLLDASGGTAEAQQAAIDARLTTLTDGVPFDAINLSFGEFSGEDPATFIDTLNLTTERIHAALPAAEVSAVIHVGNMEDTRLEYDGRDLIYYFLVQYADPTIVPYIHTVMYYNLFDDAGLAYGHEEFDEHRQYLFDRMAAGEPVVYFPESAYWVAFDNPVPTYLPLYVYSRWIDLQQIRAQQGPLDRHVLFSSGWEWGYWQNDVATLRMGWSLPDDWRDLFAEMYAPWGQPDIADALADLAEAQHTALIGQRLAPWMAGRDVLMDIGRDLGIVSQPERRAFAEIVALDPAGRAAFRAEVLDPLLAHAAATDAVRARLDSVTGDDRWIAELRDGVGVDVHRAQYMATTLDALLLHADGDTAGAIAALDTAQRELDAARAIVSRRHADLHDPDGAQLLEEGRNPTVYDYGYLARANDLCFWEREKVQADAIVRGVTGVDPGCVL